MSGEVEGSTFANLVGRLSSNILYNPHKLKNPHLQIRGYFDNIKKLERENYQIFYMLMTYFLCINCQTFLNCAFS